MLQATVTMYTGLEQAYSATLRSNAFMVETKFLS